jgi:hypothetical protein
MAIRNVAADPISITATRMVIIFFINNVNL